MSERNNPRPIPSVIADLKHAGVTLRLDGQGGIVVRGDLDHAPSELVTEAKARRDELIAHLTAQDATPRQMGTIVPIAAARRARRPVPLSDHRRRPSLVDRVRVRPNIFDDPKDGAA